MNNPRKATYNDRIARIFVDDETEARILGVCDGSQASVDMISSEGTNIMKKFAVEASNLFALLCILVVVQACAPDPGVHFADEDVGGWEVSEGQDAEPSNLREVADALCAHPPPAWPKESDSSYWLGQGVVIVGSSGEREYGRGTTRQCVGEHEVVRVEPAVAVDLRAFIVNDEDDGRAKLSTLLPREYSRIDWPRIERGKFDMALNDDFILSADVFGRADEPTRKLVLALVTSIVEQSLRDPSVTYDGSHRLNDHIDACGVGFANHFTLGGALLAMADISSLPAAGQDKLERLLAEHAPGGRVDIDAFAREFSRLELPELGYWPYSIKGYLPPIGSDLGSLIAGLPDADEHIRNFADEAMANPETQHPYFGPAIDSEVRPYGEEQIATMGLSAEEVEEFVCFRDFALETRSLLRSAHRYASEAACRRRVFGSRGQNVTHDRLDARYDDKYERLRDFYRGVAEAFDACKIHIRLDDQADLCEVCRIPEEFNLSALEAVYAEK
jgi:hypothetical protein